LLKRDILTVPNDRQQVAFMTADPDTPTARALRHLPHKPHNRLICSKLAARLAQKSAAPIRHPRLRHE
jgi:hypothetical protein